MMGMGEPLLNYDAVVPAMRLMLDDNAYGLSRRRVTLSTSGVVPMMDRLGADLPVALAVSLHAPIDPLRDMLVPLNKKYPLRELMAACQRYLKVAPRDFITFEYCMLDGVNDSEAHARELLALTRDVPCKFNLIPFNPFPESGSDRARSNEQIKRFAQVLMDAGVVTTVRKTRGDDIDAACGQLAGAVQDRTRLAAAHGQAGEGDRGSRCLSFGRDGRAAEPAAPHPAEKAENPAINDRKSAHNAAHFVIKRSATPTRL